ncbi:hypothetical protein NDU88_002625 [Pleurodeles waltl]|uniref:Secreted protein n=1 Tax=Pleurodeles waltl TaxID=8319 RepID=A0AAV7KW65_PLEWA|nr:hypothetical protein NDU88_002625 [Pleurodeles waltl]
MPPGTPRCLFRRPTPLLLLASVGGRRSVLLCCCSPLLRCAPLSSRPPFFQADLVPRRNFLAPPSLPEEIPDSLPLQEVPGQLW